jgi:hypothetical protein
VAARELPAWLAHLDDEDHQFLKRFVLSSGSLKELADAYGVSYPTIRIRLDQLIERIEALDKSPPDDAFDARVRVLVARGELSATMGKELLRLHMTVGKGGRR